MMVLVTGATGFVGRYLIKRLVSEGRDVLACGRKPGNEKYFQTLKIPFIKLDVAQKEDFAYLPDHVDAVVHLAARVPKATLVASTRECIAVNGLGTLNVLEWCLLKGVKKVVYASTQMVVGVPSYLPVDEKHSVCPRGHYASYGISKLLGELFCERVRTDFQLNCISLRFARIYGHGENAGFVLTKFIDLAESGKELTVYGEGRARRDLLYVKDAVTAIIAAIDSPCQGIYNIGSGQGTSIKELAEVISRVFSESESLVRHEFSLPEDEGDFCLDITKAQRDLAFVPKYSLEAGMADYKRERSGSGGAIQG